MMSGSVVIFWCIFKDQLLLRDCQRRKILIEANQMTRCAEAFCNFETVPPQAYRCVDIGPTTLYG